MQSLTRGPGRERVTPVGSEKRSYYRASTVSNRSEQINTVICINDFAFTSREEEAGILLLRHHIIVVVGSRNRHVAPHSLIRLALLLNLLFLFLLF